MDFLLIVFFSLVWGENLGIRYEDVIGRWINYERRAVKDKSLGVAPSVFTVEDGTPRSSERLGERVIWRPLDMFEDEFEGVPEGLLEKMGDGQGKREYLMPGYETPLDASGINHLCLSTAIRPLRISIEGIINVGIGCRAYFDSQKVRELGECLSGVLDGMKVWVFPEPLCGLVSRIGHIGGDMSLHFMVITSSGRRTVFAFYKVEMGDGKRRFENVFYVDTGAMSDWKLQKVVYEHIEAKLRRCILERDDISPENKNVSFYPSRGESAVFELKIDMRPIYREVCKALRYKEVVKNVKIVEGVNVVDSSERVRFVIEAPVFDVEEIQRGFREVAASSSPEMSRAIEEVEGRILESVGAEGRYSVMMRSEFYGNSVLDEVFSRFGKKDYIRPEDIEQGAAKLMRSEYVVVDPKVVHVDGRSKSGSQYMKEVRLRKEMREILEKKKGRTLREIFKEADDMCIEGAEGLFGDVSGVLEIEAAVEKWKELEAKESRIKEDRRLRDQALKDLKEMIASTKKKGKGNKEVWDGGLKDEVAKAQEQLDVMSSDDKYGKKDIEDAEFNLVIQSRSLFEAYEDRIRKEEEERKKEKDQEDGKEASGDKREGEEPKSAEVPEEAPEESKAEL